MIDVVLVGIKGYGELYLQELWVREEQGAIRIVGLVDPVDPDQETLNALSNREIPIFKSLEAFYSHHEADLAIISSPVQFHCEQTCFALSKGSHVLCEKPVAPTMNEVSNMVEYRNRYNRKVAIGYQWSYSQPIQRLKQDIMNGKFGKPLRLKSIVLWPRNENYFSRKWAGKRKDEAGRWVLDSVVSNATSHFFLNMFYVLGDKIDSSTWPSQVQAETYRANMIENFDTAAVKAYTVDGVELMFFASHAISPEEEFGPSFEYEFEHATVRYHGKVTSYHGGNLNLSRDGQKPVIHAILADGSEINYGALPDTHFEKLDVMLRAIVDGNVPIPCGLEAARVLPLCIEGIQQSVPEPISFPSAGLRFAEQEKVIWMDGLAELFKQGYEEWKLPHELGIRWAKSGQNIQLND